MNGTKPRLFGGLENPGGYAILYLQTFATLCTARALTPARCNCGVFHLLQGRAGASSTRPSDDADANNSYSHSCVLDLATLQRNVRHAPQLSAVRAAPDCYSPRKTPRDYAPATHSAQSARLRHRVPDVVPQPDPTAHCSPDQCPDPQSQHAALGFLAAHIGSVSFVAPPPTATVCSAIPLRWSKLAPAPLHPAHHRHEHHFNWLRARPEYLRYAQPMTLLLSIDGAAPVICPFAATILITIRPSP
ncbi:hypothetical protein DFH08DRAFT_951140 [Mycena albidolilacea]|uniref:Uncharacterized protein n=1 Tax=Mycena albidolilacea TaxID=1033008 RepID=A0AAD7AML2_9AGAR|nr:hypothetical protein DFH08DRAFT_951140 [Mycena albidolilacea]